ncbi:MAG TPA: ligase-associated DNA damage response DEXH box helicase [Phycisphaerae bacterium]|nr:ligase-associated DNA damage response DEXH box helicase [Phycisphaerae bacterium]HXK88054.1 ligase-associated DNA damage response DEXH box helicase [Phycisphaerae bacterium]
MELLEAWFDRQGWRPFEFQREAWSAYLDGASGLVHAPTGMGKSYAVWCGPLLEGLTEKPAAADPPLPRVLWITPLRALAHDTLAALRKPVEEMGLPWTVGLRTGDTPVRERRAQRERLPTALVTTPESVSLLLSYPDARKRLATLRCVVVDEWHELLGSKRGVQVELALARLRAWQPDLRTWGLSATIGNLAEATAVLLGVPSPAARRRMSGRLIQGRMNKEVAIETLRPPDMERFPWSGHLGLRLLPEVIAAIGRARSTLLFTNTRSQAELWFQGLLRARPDWIGRVALHHGSLDREIRERVEEMLRAGALQCVVCTSSLDLGVDFSPVDQVIQVGSPKGIARLMQRAGRSGHQPGAVSRILCVPTNAFELVEFSAARAALHRRAIESRTPLDRPLDVLVQHLVTVGLGGGFTPEDLWREVTRTHAFRNLSPDEWQWAVDFVTSGGPALKAYAQFSRVVKGEHGCAVHSPRVARLHRMSIGTITSESQMAVRYLGGGRLGTIEESFMARLRPGDRFIFSGQVLELRLVRDMTAYVRKAPAGGGVTPRWYGGRMPLSSRLAEAVRARLAEARNGRYADADMEAARPLLELQAAWSHIPGPGELLIETMRSREGRHFFIYPFEGRLVHEGLGPLIACRLTRVMPCSITTAATDYGFELLANVDTVPDETRWRRLLSPEGLLDDLHACLNATELVGRQFRDIARIAGLVFSGYPGQARPMRQLQASSDLFYRVFLDYDPENGLLQQARREVLDQQLEITRLRQTLERIAGMRLVQVETAQFSPMAFPIWSERLRSQHVSSERWSERVRRMVVKLEKTASRPRPRRAGRRMLSPVACAESSPKCRRGKLTPRAGSA